MSQPEISLSGVKGDLLTWRCSSGCWFPEPEMSWLDSDGNNITAEPSVTEKPSDHCYVVQRTVTVALTEHVTCRVHLPHFNRTEETQHHIRGLNPGNAMRRYFDAWVPTEVRVRVRVWVGDSIRDPRFEIAVPRISATCPADIQAHNTSRHFVNRLFSTGA